MKFCELEKVYFWQYDLAVAAVILIHFHFMFIMVLNSNNNNFCFVFHEFSLISYKKYFIWNFTVFDENGRRNHILLLL